MKQITSITGSNSAPFLTLSRPFFILFVIQAFCRQSWNIHNFIITSTCTPTSFNLWVCERGAFNSSTGMVRTFQSMQAGTHLSWFTSSGAAERQRIGAVKSIKLLPDKSSHKCKSEAVAGRKKMKFLLWQLKGFIPPQRIARNHVFLLFALNETLKASARPNQWWITVICLQSTHCYSCLNEWECR